MAFVILCIIVAIGGAAMLIGGIDGAWMLLTRKQVPLHVTIIGGIASVVAIVAGTILMTFGIVMAGA